LFFHTRQSPQCRNSKQLPHHQSDRDGGRPLVITRTNPCSSVFICGFP